MGRTKPDNPLASWDDTKIQNVWILVFPKNNVKGFLAQLTLFDVFNRDIQGSNPPSLL